MFTKANEDNSIEIMLVEDNPGDARLAKEALRECNIRNNLSIVDDGEKALDFLYKRGNYNSSPRPDLILLDLNLPDMSGVEILEKIKRDGQLRRTPVIVLTTTDDEGEINRCYDLGANAYVTKPLNYEGFARAIQQLGLFISIVKVPENA